jgi:hypothetical protein
MTSTEPQRWVIDQDDGEKPAILILMLEADFSTPTKNVITLIMTE